MSKHRSATDAIKAAQLTAVADAAKVPLDEHQAACYQCRPGKDFHKRACDRGYTLYQAWWAAEATRRGATHRSGLDEAERQGTLW